MSVDNAKAQMRKGVLEYCTLSVLSGGDAYASDIISHLRGARMIVVEGTLYPLLTRQKNAGWLDYRWEESQQGPPRKYYSITDRGRQFLADLDASWQELVETVNEIRQIHSPNTETT
ncbi:MAG: PadR family transcriptional regulator [Odoribacteraceae bacterium]|jgi:PadR family transcriptional regulator PadR|nr:PadR family transcriptional regulator [Odoribacteraceae bacterium]